MTVFIPTMAYIFSVSITSASAHSITYENSTMIGALTTVKSDILIIWNSLKNNNY
nr:hypothetical protein [uncultured Ruminococcus sp.]